MTPGMRRLLGTGLRIAASIGLFLVILEGILRLCPSVIPAKALAQFEPGLRSRLAAGRFPTRADTILLQRDDGGCPIRVFKPYARRPYMPDACPSEREVVTDEIGFGNPPGVYNSTSTIDLVSIGDSFTWPLACRPEDGWPLRLGRALGCTAYNLGREGTGPYEYLQILKRYGLAKHPRVVVMNIYEGNDIRDAVNYHAYREGRATLDEEAEPAKEGFFWRHSYVWNLAAGSALYLQERSQRKRQEKEIDYRFEVGEPGKGITFNRGQGSRDEPAHAQRVMTGEISFSAFDEAMAGFAALGGQHGFTPVVSYSPAAPAVYAPVRFHDPALAGMLGEFSRTQRQYFADKTRSLGILFVDLTPALVAAARESSPALDNLLYFPGNIHFTPRGHERVTRTLAEAVRPLFPTNGAMSAEYATDAGR